MRRIKTRLKLVGLGYIGTLICGHKLPSTTVERGLHETAGLLQRLIQRNLGYTISTLHIAARQANEPLPCVQATLLCYTQFHGNDALSAICQPRSPANFNLKF